MSVTAQSGILMFGPQFAKGSIPPIYYAHRALGTDIGVADEQRVFQPEIGGQPLPAGAYKGGVMVGGGISMNPRLEGSVGVLLHALAGKHRTAVKSLVYEGILPKTKVTAALQTISTSLGTIPSPGAKVCVRIWKGDNVVWKPTAVVVTGTPSPETFNFAITPVGGQRSDGFDTDPSTSAVGYETIVGNTVMTAVTSIAIPAFAGVGTDLVYVSVGYEDQVAMDHEFSLDDTDPSLARWLGFRKYIPKSDSSIGLGETYHDCKLVQAAISLPNDGPVEFQGSAIGRTFKFEESPAWASNPTFETYESVPISSVIGGYISIPWIDSTPLPVVNATVAWQNAPLDQRYERVFGSPYLDDVTIIGRSMSVQLSVKYTNPDLYRAILGGSKSALGWNPMPFTTRVDVQTIAPGLMTGSMLPYGLRIQAQKVMLGMKGSITLAANNAIIITLVGTALNVGGTYASYTLRNLQADAYYTWPAS